MRKNRIVKSVVAFLMMAFMLAPMAAGFIHLDEVDAYDYSTTQQIITSQTTTSSVAYGNSIFRWKSGHNPGTTARSGKHADELITPSHQSGTGLNRFYVWCVQQKKAAPDETANAIQAVNGYYSGGLHKGLAAILENGYPITSSIPMLNADGTTTSKSWSGEYARQITANAIRAFLANHGDSTMYSQMKTTVAGGYFEVNTTDCGTSANGAKESLYYLVALAESAVTGGYSDGKGGTSSSTGIKYTAWGPTLNIANHTVTKSGNNYTGTITMTHNNDVAVVSVSPSKGTVTNITRVNGSKTTCTYTVPVSSLNGNGETVTFTITYKSAKLRVWRDGKLECYIAKYPTSNVQDCLIEPWPASSQAWPNSTEPQSTKTVSFKVTPETGTLVIKKESTNHAFTDNNTYYTMSGAKYKLMTGTGSSGTAVAITNISGGTYVSNGEFTVNSGAYSSSTSIATVTISNLAPGSYILVESAGNDTYNRNTDYKNFTITSGATTTLQYSNTMVVRETPKTGSVSITKVSSNPSLTNGNSNYSLDGAVYTLTNTTLGTTYTLTTTATNNNTGIASASGLPFGAYTLTETTASQGFERSTGTYSFTLTGANPSKSLTSSDTNILSEVPLNFGIPIEITKSKAGDPNTGLSYSLAGAVYKVAKQSDDTVVATLTTDASGHASGTLPGAGSYYLFEQTAPVGFNLPNPNRYDFTVSSGSNGVSLTVSDTNVLGDTPIDGTLLLVKVDADNQQIGLSGAVYQFREYGSNDDWISFSPTNSSGELYSYLFEPGTYEIREVTPPTGYCVNLGTDTFTIVAGRLTILTGNSTYTNNSQYVDVQHSSILADSALISASINIVKTGGGSPLSGAVLQIKQGNTVLDEWTTNGSTHTFSGAWDPNLTYTLHEVSAPSGYSVAADISFTINGSGVVMINNVAQTNNTITMDDDEAGSVTIHKQSADPSTTNGNSWYSLAGATYRIKNTTTNVEYVIPATDSSGVATLGNLPLGTYQIWETFASHGFKKTTNVNTFTITSANKNVSLSYVANSNNPYEQISCLVEPLDSVELVIIKGDSDPYFSGDASLAGAVFALYKSDGTLLDGNIVITESSDGEYEAANGGLIETTDSEPFYYGVTHLPGYGDYYLVEVTPPSGYSLPSPNRFDFNFDEDFNGTRTRAVIYADTFAVIAYCDIFLDAYDGSILLDPPSHTQSNNSKSAQETRGGVAIFIPYIDDVDFLANIPNLGRLTIYKALSGTNTRLSGAVYKIKKSGSNTWITLPATDANGKASIAGLEPGTYTIEEVTAPAGYALNNGSDTFTITALHETVLTGTATSAITAESYQTVTHSDLLADTVSPIYIQKVDAATNQPLSGATFTIKQGSTTLETWVSDGTPHLVTANLVAGTTYHLEETTPPAYYFSRYDPIPFTIDSNRVVHVGGVAQPNNTITVTNTRGTVDIGIIKIDEEGGSGQNALSLAGAVYKIYDADTNQLVKTVTTQNMPANDPNYSWPFTNLDFNDQVGIYNNDLANITDYTGNYGYAETDLPAGRYYMVEDTPPTGFSLPNPNRFDFEITVSGLSSAYHISYLFIGGSYFAENTNSNNNNNNTSVRSTKGNTNPVRGGNTHVMCEVVDDDFFIESRAIDMFIEKLTGGGDALPGAVLQIKQGNTVIEQWTSTASAHKISATLTPGTTYTLHEVSAPSGYGLALDINFTVDAAGNVLIGGQTQSNNSVKMYDYKKATMPASGSETAFILACVGILIVLAGTAVIISPRRKRRTQQN